MRILGMNVNCLPDCPPFTALPNSSPTGEQRRPEVPVRNQPSSIPPAIATTARLSNDNRMRRQLENQVREASNQQSNTIVSIGVHGDALAEPSTGETNVEMERTGSSRLGSESAVLPAELFELKSALQNSTSKEEFLSSCKKFKEAFENRVLPMLSEMESTSDQIDRLNMCNHVTALLSDIKPHASYAKGSIWSFGQRVVEAVLPHYEALVNELPPHHLNDTLLRYLQKIPFFTTGDGDEGLSLAFRGMLFNLESRAPNLARIPETGHCVWFSGRSVAGNERRSVPMRGLLNSAKFVHLYRNGQLTLWTDDANLVNKGIQSLIDIAKNGGAFEEFTDALRDAGIKQLNFSTVGKGPIAGERAMDTSDAGEDGMQLADLKTALQKIRVQSWQGLFDEQWPNFPNEKKKILRARIESEINSAGPLRYPANGKDTFVLAALANKGGFAFDLDVVHNAKMDLFDPFGFQCYAEHYPSYLNSFLKFSYRPQILGATKGSEAILLGLEKTADFLADMNRYGEKRGTVKQKKIQKTDTGEKSQDGYKFDKDSRYKLSHLVCEQHLHAMVDLYGEDCFYRYSDHMMGIEKFEDTAYKLADVAYADGQPNLSIKRRASALT